MMDVLQEMDERRGLSRAEELTQGEATGPWGLGEAGKPGPLRQHAFRNLLIAFSGLGMKPYWFRFEIWTTEETGLESERHLYHFIGPQCSSGRLMWEPMSLQL